MLRVTRGLGEPTPALPPGGNGRSDESLGTRYVYDRDGWAVYAGRSGERCEIVSSATLNQFEIDTQWQDAREDGTGYNLACDCYCYGYRPRWTPPVLYGLSGPDANAAYSTFPRVQSRPPFRVCTGHNVPSEIGCRECPPATAPAPSDGGAPPLQTFTPQQQQGGGFDEWGTNLGWLLAGAVIAGGGFYAYKKGVFKRSYWKGK